ncbi:MAG: PIN domain-containing protein [Dehalococcoidia bacterium]|nr:PIN domain-containing protein [Dehalococcoidia bacterium]
MAIYADSSAIVKLVIAESESQALEAYVAARSPLFSCQLLRVELVRAVRRQDERAVERARRLLDQVTLLELADDVLQHASLVDPVTVRSVDAIHLAAALMLGDDLEAVVTYDGRMAEAAQGLGLRVEQPA